MFRHVIAAGLLGLLSACGGGGPSESAMRQTMMKAMGGNQASQLDWSKFEKIHCTASALGGYDCDFIGPVGYGPFMPVNARFVKSASGWQVIVGFE